MKLKPLLYVPFSTEHVKDRNLVIKMLQYEEQLATSDYGQQRYKDPLNRRSLSLDNEYAFNRMTLTHFGYNNDEQSVQNYRNIFRTYFRNPEDYDQEVINSSYYMRGNRCVYYRTLPLTIGKRIPNCPLYNLDGKGTTDLYSAIGSDNSSAMICAFSMS